MQNQSDNTSRLAHICLSKSGLSSNLPAVIECFEEQIYDNSTPLSLELFEITHDYKLVKYGGIQNAKLKIINDGELNPQINFKITDSENCSLLKLTMNGELIIRTMRDDSGNHQLSLMLAIPLSPTKDDSRRIQIFTRISVPNSNSAQPLVEAFCNEEDEPLVQKALTMYSLS